MNNQIDAPSIQSENHSTSTAPAEIKDTVFGLLNPIIGKTVAAGGYTTPTPIQEQCIPHLLEGRDILGSAQTGTGKTAAFTLPLLHRLAADPRQPRRGSPRALILAPTRELAAQIGASIETYGKNLKLYHTVIFGGVGQNPQVRALNRGVDILVATPGRLLDLMQQGHIHLKDVEVFILDEVDRMLDMGFVPDIKRVLAKIPDNRQTMFFSATMAPKMLELAHQMVHDPIRVTITPNEPAVDRIQQKVLFVGKRDKDALLVSLLADSKIEKAIIFTQMKFAANRVVQKLEAAGIYGAAIHGNKSQSARTKALDGFKKGRFKVLVATDVAARGLDVDGITHVFNYDLPVEAETYVHRIGRTARAGAEGDAISFCCAEDRGTLREIERLLGKPVPTETEHSFHCEEASRSTAAAVKPGGGGQRGGRRGGGGGNSRGRSGGGGNRRGGSQHRGRR